MAGNCSSSVLAIFWWNSLPRALEERLIGGVLNQGVLEGVVCVGWRAAAEHQLRGDELVEGLAEFILGQG